MSTLGQKPATQHVSTEKQTITGNGGTSYTLQQSVSQASDIEVFVNNTRQEPTVAYTANNTTLTMTGAVNSSDSFYVIFQGKAIQTAGLPVDAAITASTISTSQTITSTGNITTSGTLNTPSINGGQIGGSRNMIINGAMQVAQRGTSIAVSSALVYTLDRFAAENDTTTMTATQASDAPTGFEYSLKLTNGTGATATGTHINRIRYALEGYDTNQLEIGTANAKKVTLSFHVKSSITGTYIVSFLDSGNDNGYPASYTINSANTWEKKTITLTMSDYGSWVGSSTNAINLILHWDLGSGPDRDLSNLNAWNDGSANDFSHSSQTEWVGTTGSTFYLTGVQLEVGSQATPFEHRSFGEELRLCQRYYYREEASSVSSSTSYKRYGVGQYYSATAAEAFVYLPVTMRAVPTLETTGTSTDYAFYAGSNVRSISNNFSLNGSTDKNFLIVNGTTSSQTLGHAASLLSNNNTTSFIAANAEL